jgi:putative transcriptional regulator
MAGLENNIRALRAGANLRQEDLAEAVGVTRQTIIAIEKGGYVPSLELAFKISQIFNQPIEQIFHYD